MYRNEYEKALEQVKTAVEFARDCSNISRCEANLRYYNRGQALVCLQDMIREYAVQIDTVGFMVDGMQVIRGVPLDQFTDDHIRAQLQYLIRRIPAYVLLREGQKELAKQMCQWLDQGKHNM
jgi:hypothetical protein